MPPLLPPLPLPPDSQASLARWPPLPLAWPLALLWATPSATPCREAAEPTSKTQQQPRQSSSSSSRSSSRTTLVRGNCSSSWTVPRTRPTSPCVQASTRPCGSAKCSLGSGHKRRRQFAMQVQRMEQTVCERIGSAGILDVYRPTPILLPPIFFWSFKLVCLPCVEGMVETLEPQKFARLHAVCDKMMFSL